MKMRWLASARKLPASVAGYLFDCLSDYTANLFTKCTLGLAGSTPATWIGSNPRKIFERRSLGVAQVSCCAVLALWPISMASCVAADGKQSPRDRSSELKAAGYTELSGADAFRFLVGNSIRVNRSDAERKKDMVGNAIYYFLTTA